MSTLKVFRKVSPRGFRSLDSGLLLGERPLLSLGEVSNRGAEEFRSWCFLLFRFEQFVSASEHCFFSSIFAASALAPPMISWMTSVSSSRVLCRTSNLNSSWSLGCVRMTGFLFTARHYEERLRCSMGGCLAGLLLEVCMRGGSSVRWRLTKLIPNCGLCPLFIL